MSGTVDFVQEILGTPANDLARRVGELSPDLRAQILREVVLRVQALGREEAALRSRVEQMGYHIERLERLIANMAGGVKK